MRRLFSILAVLPFLLVVLFSTASADAVVVAFEKKEYSILAGKTDTIKPVVQGTKTKGQFTYSSSDELVATVNNGKVKGISPGDVTINCMVLIGSEEFACSYVLHVLQPVTAIEVPEKEMTLPADAKLRELPYKVLPENAANKEIEIIYNGKKASLREDGGFPGSSIAMNRTYTLKATDGSNVTAKFRYIVPKVAWFSVDNNTVIDSPDGIDFFYVTTFNPSGWIYSVKAYDDNKNITCNAYFLDKDIVNELLKDEPFYIDYDTCVAHIEYLHVVPLKAGKGTFTVVVNGHKATLSFVISRSAVYEDIKYEQYQKKESQYKSLRFQTSGIISSIEGSSIYFSYEGDEGKQMVADIPETIDIANLKPGEDITVKGFFTGMCEYTSETGLKKSIPAFLAEKIE